MYGLPMWLGWESYLCYKLASICFKQMLLPYAQTFAMCSGDTKDRDNIVLAFQEFTTYFNIVPEKSVYSECVCVCVGEGGGGRR